MCWFDQSSKRQRQRTRHRGFTLLEVIVVVTIIALLAALVAPRLLGNVDRARVRTAESGVAQISQQVNVWLLDNSYSSPPDDFELSLLTEGGDQALLRKKDLIDPWGNPYVFDPDGENPVFDIVSYGADGEPGGEGYDADIRDGY